MGNSRSNNYSLIAQASLLNFKPGFIYSRLDHFEGSTLAISTIRIAEIEHCSVPTILIFAIARIVHACLHKATGFL